MYGESWTPPLAKHSPPLTTVKMSSSTRSAVIGSTSSSASASPAATGGNSSERAGGGSGGCGAGIEATEVTGSDPLTADPMSAADGGVGGSTTGPLGLVGALRSLDNTLRQHMDVMDRLLSSRQGPISLVGSLRKSRVGSSASGSGAFKDDIRPMPEFSARKREDKVTVYIRVVFLKIGEIDTLKEKYAADVFIQARWREPSLDGQTHLEPEVIEWDDYWKPLLFVENLLGEAKETTWYMVSFDDQQRCTVYEKRRVNATFLEYLELEQFPFDTQDLTITVSTERSENEISLEEDHSEICGINVQSFADEQEWRLHNHVETWRKLTTKVFHNQKFRHPALSVACKASRRPGFFIWNILFVMLFICSLAFATFAVDRLLPQNRLQLSFILLLTTITFKFVVNQSLPRISYLTYLDKYILTSMTILCLVCVWHSVVPLMPGPSGDMADRAALAILGSLYVFFHAFFFIWIFCSTHRRRWTIVRKDEEHKAREFFAGIDPCSSASEFTQDRFYPFKLILEKMKLMERLLDKRGLSDSGQKWNSATRINIGTTYGSFSS